jgi:chromosome segregation ATPase
MPNEQIVTELIVDARGAKEGTAEYDAALRVAQNSVDKFTATLEKQRQASQASGDSATDAGQRLQETARSYSSAERAANSYLARLDPVFFAQQKIAAEAGAAQSAINGLDQMLLRGSVTVDQYNSRQQLLQGRLGEVKAAAAGLASGSLTVEQALKSITSATDQAASRADDARTKYDQLNATLAATAQRIQQTINQSTGIGSGTNDYAARAADIAAYGNALDQVRAKFNPVFAASKQYEAELNEISEAEKVGALTATEAAAARDRETATFARLNPALNQHGVSLGNAAFAQRQLAVQSVQFFSSIQAGQPILTAAIQQGHQLADVAFAAWPGDCQRHRCGRCRRDSGVPDHHAQCRDARAQRYTRRRWSKR